MAKPLVVDFGTVNIRVGRAGDKLPTSVFAPLFGQPLLDCPTNEGGDLTGINGSNWLDCAIFPLNPREKYDNTIPMPMITYSDGEYKINYHMLEKMLESTAISKGTDENLEGSTIITSEPNMHTPSFRKTIAEVLLEGQRVEKFYMCKRAPLSCYASGRTSGIVVDIGGSCSNVTPVTEGFVIQELIKEEPIGGSLMDRIFYDYLNKAGTTIRPSFEYAKASKSDDSTKTKAQKKSDEKRKLTLRKIPFVHASYYHYAKLHATSRVKEAWCIMSDQVNIKTKATDSSFALPDGSYLNPEIGKDLCSIFCRCIFNDASYLKNEDAFKKFETMTLSKPAFGNKEETISQILENCKGLDVMLDEVYTRVKKPESSLWSYEMQRAVILSGGTTNHPTILPLLRRRFEQRITDVESPLFMSFGGLEQQYSSFIGASILASMGMFDTLCITKDDCQEHGTERILQRKCP